MAILLAARSNYPEVFSNVPSLAGAAREFQEKNVVQLLGTLGKIFIKHDVQSKFALCMAHRHFDLLANEILVESMSEDNTKSVAVPWRVDGSSAQPTDPSALASHGIPVKKFVGPQTWVFSTASGTLAPIEFVALNDNETVAEPGEEFGQELFGALKELGIERIVGLCSLDKEVGCSFETTAEGTRASVTVFGERKNSDSKKENKKGMPVTWFFDNEGVLREGNRCCAV